MRTAGFFLLISTSKLNAIAPRDARSIRILTLGESTTADIFSEGQESSWPRLLEKKLRDHGLKVRVYNEGLPGTQTPFILSHVKDYLRIYKPNIVISMMGVNDQAGFVFDDSSSGRALSMAVDLRLWKLSRWIWKAVQGGYYQCRFSPKGSWELTSLSNKANEMKHRPVEEVERELRKFSSRDEDIALALTSAAAMLRGEFNDPNEDRASIPFAERAYSLAPRNYEVISRLLSNPAMDQDRCAEVGKELFKCADNLSDDILATLGYCSEAHPELGNSYAYESRGIFWRGVDLETTGVQHRRLANMLMDSGVKYIAMQYPTRPIEQMQAYFDNSNGQRDDRFREIIVVENESNFAKALQSHSYDEVFSDRFRQTWGHATRFGQGLIADQLVPVIEGLASKIRLP